MELGSTGLQAIREWSLLILRTVMEEYESLL